MVVSAQMQEYKDYTIIRGDTLWDITNKELKDPFLWPKVWKENPEIKNPDRIYPNQRIKIPLYLLQKEITLEPKVAAKPEEIKKPEGIKIEPVKKPYLVDKTLLISSGYIVDEIHSVGKIIETPTGKTVLGRGDYAYIDSLIPIKKGDKFYIIKPMEKVKHPKTGHKIGYLIEVIGIVEVVDEKDPKITILDSFWEVTTGNLLEPYYEIEPIFAPEKPRNPDMSGYIVATKHSHLINVPFDVAYIDMGRKDGLQIGDVLATLVQSKHRIVNGLIQVINLRESTATVIVRKSDTEILKGDPVTKAMQE
jgi:hypothetical protein